MPPQSTALQLQFWHCLVKSVTACTCMHRNSRFADPTAQVETNLENSALCEQNSTGMVCSLRVTGPERHYPCTVRRDPSLCDHHDVR